MKAHKYWSLGALACMAGCFYTGCKKLMQAHKYFACGALVCMGMAQSTPATKLHRRRKKLKSLKSKNTHFTLQLSSFSRSRSDRRSPPTTARPANADRGHGLIDSEDLVTSNTLHTSL